MEHFRMMRSISFESCLVPLMRFVLAVLYMSRAVQNYHVPPKKEKKKAHNPPSRIRTGNLHHIIANKKERVN